TNDLTQMVFGLSRDDVVQRMMGTYLELGLFPADPFTQLDAGAVAPLVAAATRSGRMVRPDMEVGVCGEHGGDPESIHLLVKAGVDSVSCSPFRVPVARLAVAQALIDLDG
ncbi:MAG: putative PEP-binding protein, partial [Actinomycetota bacterium]|nr:putative PEP-binding protein [Actinomycetota bacterium]